MNHHLVLQKDHDCDDVHDDKTQVVDLVVVQTGQYTLGVLKWIQEPLNSKYGAEGKLLHQFLPSLNVSRATP